MKLKRTAFSFISLIICMLFLYAELASASRDWHGETALDPEEFSFLIKEVGFDVGIHDENFYKLIFETAAAESDLGRYAAFYEGNHVGTFQLSCVAAEDTLRWLKNNNEEILKVIDGLRAEDLSLRENLRRNLYFATAVTFAYYLARGGTRLSRIETVEQRAKLWKDKYNTYLGAGTVSFYLKRANIWKYPG